MILKATLPLLYPSAPASEASKGLRLRLRAPGARLRRTVSWQGRQGPVTLGTPAVPYEPAGRSPLASLEGAEGLEISVVTRSPEIVGEVELLADLDRRCSVTVDLVIPAADAALARKVESIEKAEAEAPAPAPRARMAAVARLAEEGITVRVLCPLVDGINDGEAALRKLFTAALEAGAWDIRPLPAPHHRLFVRPGLGSPAGLATFRSLRLEFGFPREIPGRG